MIVIMSPIMTTIRSKYEDKKILFWIYLEDKSGTIIPPNQLIFWKNHQKRKADPVCGLK